MAYERSGMADKLGNRFEKRWVVQQFLHLLAGHLRSVMYEPVGPDEKGVDLWITRPDGRREAQQCKGEQGTRPEWSIADLARRGILGHLREQRQRDSAHEFALVSATPAGIFRDLTRSARDAETAMLFWEYSVRDRSGTHREEFLRFCEALRLNHEVQADLESAFDLLRRSISTSSATTARPAGVTRHGPAATSAGRPIESWTRSPRSRRARVISDVRSIPARSTRIFAERAIRRATSPAMNGSPCW